MILINYSNLVTIITALMINIIITIFLIYREIQNPKKYKGLRIWILSSVLRFISIGLTFIFNNNTQKGYYPMTYLSYTLNIISFSILSYSLYKFINKKINKLNMLLLIIPLPILLIPIILNNINMFLLTITILIIYFSLQQLFILNKNTKSEVKSEWITYSVLQLFVSLFTTIYIILRTIEYRNNFEGLINFGETNILIKSIVLLSAMNAMLIILSLEVYHFMNKTRINKFLEMLVELSDSDHMIIDTSTNKIVEIKTNLLTNIGYKHKDELIEENFDKLLLNQEQCDKIKEVLKVKNNYETDLDIILKDETYKNFNLLFRNISFQNKTYCLINFNEKEFKYKKLAYQDELTKLPNRRKLYELFEHYKMSNSEFYLIFIDIDNFKELNDTKGHLYGDLVLETIGYELDKYNEGKLFASRYGGDEFILFIPKDNKTSISNYITKINAIFEEQIEINKSHVKINVSIGYSKYPKDGNNIDELIKLADKKLYKVKTEKKR